MNKFSSFYGDRCQNNLALLDVMVSACTCGLISKSLFSNFLRNRLIGPVLVEEGRNIMFENSNARYKLLHKIGEGVHGIVLKAQDTYNNRIVAIKKVSLRTKYGEVALSTVREIKALQHCDCDNVSKL